MSQSSAYHLSGLLEKMTANDKDFRFMATNDLMSELQGDSLRLDDDSERKVTKTVLKLLEDQNGEVQNLAVKCLGPLIRKIKEANIVLVVKELTTGMVSSDKDNIRGICGIGLKTIINEAPASHITLAHVATRDATLPLTMMAENHTDVSVRLEALEILTEMLSKFGVTMAPYHDQILSCCVNQLSNPRLAVRKRAIVALGHLVCCSSHEQFDTLIQHLLRQLKHPPPGIKQEDIKTYIQCLTVLTRHPTRTSEYVHEIEPLLMSYASRDDDEIRDFVLQGLETLVRKCPRQMAPFLKQVVPLLLQFLQHDPNYQYGGGDEDDMMDLDEDDEDYDDDEEDYSDDDDISWKVRRSAAKCLDTCVQTYADKLGDFYTAVAPVLVKRFIEREETVKLEIFNAFHTIIKQTRHMQSGASTLLIGSTTESLPGSPLHHLEGLVGLLVRSLQRQARSKSIQVRCGVFALLREMILTLSGGFTQYIDTLIPIVIFTMNDKLSNNNMKVETIAFVVLLIENHQAKCFRSHMQELVKIAAASSVDPFYRIACEALGLIQCLAMIAKQLGYAECASVLFEPTLKQLEATDRDLELKEKAIACTATLIYYLGDVLGEKTPISLQIIAERLRNEITRYQAVKAITTVGESPLNIDISRIMVTVVGDLASFLRKNDRSLRVVTLKCLCVLWEHHGDLINDTCLAHILREIPPMITDNDLQITHLLVHLLELLLIRHRDAVAGVVASTLLDPLTRLAHSPLLHGLALDSLLSLFATISRLGLEQLNYQVLLSRLLAPIRHPEAQGIVVHKDAFPNLGRAVAQLLRGLPEVELNRLIDLLTADVKNEDNNPSVRYLSLLTLGDIGRNVDLYDRAELRELIMSAFDSKSEEMKIGAAFTLGKMAQGQLSRFMPYIMGQIEKQPRQQYFLLHSLREIIGSLTASSQVENSVLMPYRDTIWTLLLNNSGREEEGTRNLVAECIGKLTLMDPVNLLPRLRDLVVNEKTTTPLSRCTLVTSVKYTIVVPPHSIDAALHKCISAFLSCLHSSDLNVRRAALITLNTAAHNKPGLIRELLPDLLPGLYNETIIKKELIREVEMGPFKHQEDDGLDLRKGAFECMYTLLESCLDRLDIAAFLGPVENGLSDHSDIKLLTYLMLARLCSLCPTEIINKIEKLLNPIKTILLNKLKQDSVKQEVEKLDELKRAAMKVVVAFSQLEDIDKNRHYTEFMKTSVQYSSDLRKMYQSVKEEVALQQQGSFDNPTL